MSKIYVPQGSNVFAPGTEVVVFTDEQINAARLLAPLPEEDLKALFGLSAQIKQPKPKAAKKKVQPDQPQSNQPTDQPQSDQPPQQAAA